MKTLICQFIGCSGWQAEMLGNRFSPRYLVKQPAGLSQKASLKCSGCSIRVFSGRRRTMMHVNKSEAFSIRRCEW
jgi:hypothetical protein